MYAGVESRRYIVPLTLAVIANANHTAIDVNNMHIPVLMQILLISDLDLHFQSESELNVFSMSDHVATKDIHNNVS